MSEPLQNTPAQLTYFDNEFVLSRKPDITTEADGAPEPLVGREVDLGKRAFLLSKLLDISAKAQSKEALVRLYFDGKKLPRGVSEKDIKRYRVELPVYRKAARTVFRHAGEFDALAEDISEEADVDFLVQTGVLAFNEAYMGPHNEIKRKEYRKALSQYAERFDKEARDKWEEEHPLGLPEYGTADRAQKIN